MSSISKRALRIFILLTLCCLGMPAAWPQANAHQASTNARPAFDAASVKMHGGGPGGINLHQASGHVSIRGFTLQQLMAVAYDLPSLSEANITIIGVPNWGTVQRFDIDAEAPGSPTIPQKLLMLQSLLTDRFKLVAHHETRQLPIYAMTLAHAGKLGPQIHPYAANERCNTVASSEFESLGPQHALIDGANAGTQSPAAIAMAALEHYPCGHIVGGLLSANDRNQVWSGARNVDMEMIAAGIGTMEDIDRPVVNETGLSGNFDFTVEWDIRVDHLATNPSPAPQSEPLGDSLFEAFRRQLGLELKIQKGPVDVIVIDHVETPKPN